MENLDNKPSYGDIMDRGTDISGLGSNGGGSAPEGNWSWDKPYSHIRTCNILLEKAEAYDGSQSDIAQSVGTAYFFAHGSILFVATFGGVPISDHVLTVSDGVLQAPRNSRYEVAAFIMSDLREAVKRLPKETEIPEGSKGKVSKEAAKSFWPEYCFMRLRGKVCSCYQL